MTGARWPRPWLPWTPSPDELRYAPELASLAVLDHAVAVAIAALHAAHSYLGDDERPCWRLPHPCVPEADALLVRALRLERALARYRDLVAVLHAAAHADDLPAAPDDNDF